MNILYAIQGTGNGHLSRANDIIPVLQTKGNVDVLVSGVQADVTIPYTIKYRMAGMSFIFGKRGGVDLWRTYQNTNTIRYLREIQSLPIHQYDLVINDFESVSAWAAHFREVPCIALSHQAAVAKKNAPKPKSIDKFGMSVLKHYAPAKHKYGFHFQQYDKDTFTPVIRKQVRDLDPTDEGSYTVYLPAYDDQRIVKKLNKFKGVRWEVFSKHTHKPYSYNNINVHPIENSAFISSMAKSAGVLCGAGFETPAEALFLGKKLMVIPIKNQYEQQCNAAALEMMGVSVIKSFKNSNMQKLSNWLESNQKVEVNYPNCTELVIDTILNKHG